MDDIVVKSRKAGDLIDDLEIAFKCLREKGIKLNPEKCVFGVPQGMLLGFIVSERGIEANPEKVSAVTSMGPIRDLKGVQRVMGCLMALSRFISRLGEKGLPLYHLLRKSERFSWTPRGRRSPRQAQGTAHQSSRPGTSSQGRAPLTLCHRNNPSGQRGRGSGEAGRGARSTHPMTYLLHQRSAL